jgi:hypothetical protein
MMWDKPKPPASQRARAVGSRLDERISAFQNAASRPAARGYSYSIKGGPPPLPIPHSCILPPSLLFLFQTFFVATRPFLLLFCATLSLFSAGLTDAFSPDLTATPHRPSRNHHLEIPIALRCEPPISAHRHRFIPSSFPHHPHNPQSWLLNTVRGMAWGRSRRRAPPSQTTAVASPVASLPSRTTGSQTDSTGTRHEMPGQVA